MTSGIKLGLSQMKKSIGNLPRNMSGLQSPLKSLSTAASGVGTAIQNQATAFKEGRIKNKEKNALKFLRDHSNGEQETNAKNALNTIYAKQSKKDISNIGEKNPIDLSDASLPKIDSNNLIGHANRPNFIKVLQNLHKNHANTDYTADKLKDRFSERALKHLHDSLDMKQNSGSYEHGAVSNIFKNANGSLDTTALNNVIKLVGEAHTAKGEEKQVNFIMALSNVVVPKEDLNINDVKQYREKLQNLVNTGDVLSKSAESNQPLFAQHKPIIDASRTLLWEHSLNEKKNVFFSGNTKGFTEALNALNTAKKTYSNSTEQTSRSAVNRSEPTPKNVFNKMLDFVKGVFGFATSIPVSTATARPEQPAPNGSAVVRSISSQSLGGGGEEDPQNGGRSAQAEVTKPFAAQPPMPEKNQTLNNGKLAQAAAEPLPISRQDVAKSIEDFDKKVAEIKEKQGFSIEEKEKGDRAQEAPARLPTQTIQPKAAATKIQSAFRGHQAKKNFTTTKAAATKLQSAFRGNKIKKAYTQLNEAKSTLGITAKQANEEATKKSRIDE